MQKLRCPSCKSNKAFELDIEALITIDGDQNPLEGPYGIEYDKNSECSCEECGFEGTFVEFYDEGD